MLTSLNAKFGTYRNFITFKHNFINSDFSHFTRIPEGQNVSPS